MLHFFNQSLSWCLIYFCNALCLSLSGIGWSDWRLDTKKVKKFDLLYEESRLTDSLFQSNLSIFLSLSPSTFFNCRTIFNTLLPRKNLDNVKISDPKSQNVEEVFLFLKINCAFHKNRWPQFNHQAITRFYSHFYLHSSMTFVAFASSYLTSIVRTLSEIAHR